MASLAVKVTRAAIGAVSRVSTERAGQLAFRIFARSPSGKPASAKEAAVLENAAPRMAEARRWHLVIPRGVVAAFEFLPAKDVAERGTVLVVHGYRSRTEHMLAIVDRLTSDGFRVVAIDLPGHGASRSRDAHLANSVEAIDAAWRQFGPFEAFVGHSFGAAAILSAAAGALPAYPARNPNRLVTVASPTKMQFIFDFFSSMMRLTPDVRDVFERQVVHLTGRPVSFFDAATSLAGLDTPTLVLHARDDKEVGFANAERLAAAGSHVTLATVDGFGHRRILAAPPLLEEISAFLRKGTAGEEIRPVPQQAHVNGRPREVAADLRRRA